MVANSAQCVANEPLDLGVVGAMEGAGGVDVEPLTSPLALLPIAWLALGPWALIWTLALLWLRDVGGWLALRGPRAAWLPALLSPLRELSILGLWLCTPLGRHVTWRGHRVRVGTGTLLFDRHRDCDSACP